MATTCVRRVAVYPTANSMVVPRVVNVLTQVARRERTVQVSRAKRENAPRGPVLMTKSVLMISARDILVKAWSAHQAPFAVTVSVCPVALKSHVLRATFVLMVSVF